MSKLSDFLVDKRQAVLGRKEKFRQVELVPAQNLKAKVRIAGRSGVREIRIRDFQVISDSPDDFAGHNLGPGSPELQLGVLGSCLTHITLIQAAEQDIVIDSLEVEVTGQMHPLAGRPGYETVPVYLHNIAYSLYIVSPASEQEITALHQAVEQACPILNLLTQPQAVKGTIVYTSSVAEDSASQI